MRIRFADCVLDTEARQVLRGGAAVHLSPKAYELLKLLAEACPRALSKDELYQHLWPDTFVVEANITNLMAEVRSAIGDNGHNPHVIRTVHGFGYAFGTEAIPMNPALEPAARPAACSLFWNNKRFDLVGGENVIGRDPAAEVRIDLPSVSRRHARIVVSEQQATIEDLGSKNGTLVGGRRITGAISLGDRDEVQVGSVVVTFHRWAPERSTETIQH
jgi:DNA-binding winged helix-turn-helix (wHTH) protein